MQFSDYIAPVGQICVVSGQCSPYYMDWFYMISHLFMSLTQLGDPPRVLLVQQYDTFVEPDVYQQPMVATTPNEANVDVNHVRHAVVIFFFVFVFVAFFCILLLIIVMFVFFSLARMTL